MPGTLAPPRPPVRPSFYCYSIVDVRTNADIDVRMTRADCRGVIQFHEDADHLRIRRCRATRFES